MSGKSAKRERRQGGDREKRIVRRMPIERAAWTPFESVAIEVDGATGEERPPAHPSWVNSRYYVTAIPVILPGAPIDELKRAQGGVMGPVGGVELTIKERERFPYHDWRDLQRIKSELLGDEWEAVELYPAESRLVDTADQWWLYCWPPGHSLPFGMRGRAVTEVDNPGGSQRVFDAHTKPKDLGKFDELFKSRRDQS